MKIRTITGTMDDYLKEEVEATADLYLARWAADFADADTFAYILQSEDGFLSNWIGSPEIDRLIEQGRTESDPEMRHSTYRRIEEIIAEEALLIPFFHEQVYRFARPELKDLSVSYQSPCVPYEKLKIAPRRGSRKR